MIFMCIKVYSVSYIVIYTYSYIYIAIWLALGILKVNDVFHISQPRSNLTFDSATATAKIPGIESPRALWSVCCCLGPGTFVGCEPCCGARWVPGGDSRFDMGSGEIHWLSINKLPFGGSNSILYIYIYIIHKYLWNPNWLLWEYLEWVWSNEQDCFFCGRWCQGGS